MRLWFLLVRSSVPVMTSTTAPTASIPTARTPITPSTQDETFLARIASSKARREALAPNGLFADDSPVVCPEVNAHPFRL